MREQDEIARLRMGLHHAVGYLQHFKDDAECKLVSYPDSIQRAIDDIKGVLNGGQAGDAYRAPVEDQSPVGNPPLFKRRAGLDALVMGARL